MGFCLTELQMNQFINTLKSQYQIYAPKVYSGDGRFSGTDCIRYGSIRAADEIVFDRKSDYSFKEVLTPISQTLFYFTEKEVKEPEFPQKKAVIFLRSCDLHAVKRLDDMYLNNGKQDYYYRKLREHVKFILMGCGHSFENCFCVSMGTNKSEDYDLSIDVVHDKKEAGVFRMDCQDEQFREILEELECRRCEAVPASVTKNDVKVHIPEALDFRVAKSSMWDEYDSRCINCGRCNYVCPTCTCFTMQDIFYSENGRVGERRRVSASCMVDGYSDVAGGGSYRQKNGDRMRFKVLHKVLDHNERFGHQMCVGCGRCDDICPEYISFSNCINKLEDEMKEVTADDEE